MANHSFTGKQAIASSQLIRFPSNHARVVLFNKLHHSHSTAFFFQAQAYYQQGFKYEAGMGVPKNIEEARSRVQHLAGI